ncbi:MAG: DUF2589 domain-containing protein [Eubacterium sp.]|nr:DUF2589 domain-containing protein [Eubacterium sp.]
MSVSNQFSGLDMKNLIGAPLSAAADASVQLAQSTANFINNVGFDSDGKVRNVDFGYSRRVNNDDGTIEVQDLNVKIPMLAITPIPNLQVDEVNITFDMEVKESEQSESSTDASASISGSGSIFGFKVSVSGSVSSHSSNTRSTDNSAKYHVDVSATNHGTPEGLSRVLDMIAANVAPSLVSSVAVDDYNNPVTGDAKKKNDELKALKAKKKQLEIASAAAESSYNNELILFKREIKNIQNQNEAKIQQLITSESDESKLEKYTQTENKVRGSWENLYNNASDTVKIVSSADDKGSALVTKYSKLYQVTDDGGCADYSEDADSKLEISFNNSIKKYITYIGTQNSLTENENEISALLLTSKESSQGA